MNLHILDRSSTSHESVPLFNVLDVLYRTLSGGGVANMSLGSNPRHHVEVQQGGGRRHLRGGGRHVRGRQLPRLLRRLRDHGEDIHALYAVETCICAKYYKVKGSCHIMQLIY